MVTNTDNHRQAFLTSYLEALRRSAERRSWKAVVPFWIVVSLIVGSAVSYFVPNIFWTEENWEVSATIYSGILTFNGLMLALSWSAFSKIYEIISAPMFSSYLKKHDLLNGYIVYVSYVHMVQIVAVVASALGLVSVLFEIGSIWADRSILALVAASTIYSIKQASSAITGMHDLIWQKAIFDEGVPSENGESRRGDGADD